MKLHPFKNPKRPLSTPLFFITLAVLLVGLSLLSKSASAYDQEIAVEFDQLDVRKHRGQVVVDYEIDRECWHMLHHVSIAPRLYLYLPGHPGHHGGFEYQRSYTLHHRKGALTFPRQVKLRGAKFAQLRLVGNHGYYRIDEIRYGRKHGDRIRVRVSRRHVHGSNCGHPGYDRPQLDHDHGHDRHRKKKERRRHRSKWTAKVIRVCGQHSSGLKASECLKLARKLERRRRAVATIRACGEQSHWSSDFKRCMKGAAGLRRTPVRTIEACGAATHWSSDFHQCLQTASHIRRGAPATVEACSESTHWSSDFQSCLEASTEYAYNPAPTIRACRAASYWSSDFRECIESA